MTKTLKFTAVGPDRDGCTDLPEIDLPRWHGLGGQDIIVWGTDWTVVGTHEAFAYVNEIYSLECVTECA